jgi:putative membrane fusion protein
MAAYFGFYAWRSSREALVTSPAVKTTLTETADVTGIAVRDETVIASDRAYVFVSAGDGKDISKGAVIASAMDSEAALERAGRKHELENEISYLETMLSGITTSDDLSRRDDAIRSAVLAISACTATGNLTGLDGACVELSSLVFSDDTAVSESDLDALKSELESIENSTYSDSEDITAPESGIFTTILDGFENLTPDTLSDLSPADVKQMLSDQGTIPTGAIGKLVTGFRWYFAGVMSDADAEKLSEGTSVNVSFGRNYGDTVKMRVEHISTASGGQRAVVLSSLYALSDTLAMRAADAEIICSECTGLRVPTKALHVDVDGNSFVYLVTADQVAVKTVETLCETGDYFLVAIGTDADALREGDEVVVSGNNVHEGMIID